MTRVWFAGELETVAMFWRVARRDGITLGFTTHDRDLWIDGVLHSASPGMVPSAIRRSADFEPDSAEIEGALSHAAITSADLAEGRFDGAQLRVGLVDWETGAYDTLYRGTIGAVREEAGRFSAELASRKVELLHDPVPRTSPSCRAKFCGPGCTLDPAEFSYEAQLVATDFDTNAVGFSYGFTDDRLIGGTVRWLDGPHAGTSMTVMQKVEGLLVLDTQLAPGAHAILREGCDHTLETCAERFANAVNFQGEPFLPGNDMISRYPPAST